jgi:hypothetical protein
MDLGAPPNEGGHGDRTSTAPTTDLLNGEFSVTNHHHWGDTTGTPVRPAAQARLDYGATGCGRLDILRRWLPPLVCPWHHIWYHTRPEVTLPPPCPLGSTPALTHPSRRMGRPLCRRPAPHLCKYVYGRDEAVANGSKPRSPARTTAPQHSALSRPRPRVRLHQRPWVPRFTLLLRSMIVGGAPKRSVRRGRAESARCGATPLKYSRSRIRSRCGDVGGFMCRGELAGGVCRLGGRRAALEGWAVGVCRGRRRVQVGSTSGVR